MGTVVPMAVEITVAYADGEPDVSAGLSGNLKFEARIHPEVKANYLASPPLVVAYALAGRIDIDLTTEPLGQDREGRDVFLRDLWPAPREIAELIGNGVDTSGFRRTYPGVYTGQRTWAALPVPTGNLFAWDSASTYVRRPPYFDGIGAQARPIEDITGARCLVVLGDSVTTDHISPAGTIDPDSPAGEYLRAHGIER